MEAIATTKQNSKILEGFYSLTLFYGRDTTTLCILKETYSDDGKSICITVNHAYYMTKRM